MHSATNTLGVNKKEIYDNFLSKLETALNEDNFENIDYILEFLYTSWIDEDILNEIDDILQEATLYAELKEEDYKNEALILIEEFK